MRFTISAAFLTLLVGVNAAPTADSGLDGRALSDESKERH